jgi:hypothetical protein
VVGSGRRRCEHLVAERLGHPDRQHLRIGTGQRQRRARVALDDGGAADLGERGAVDLCAAERRAVGVRPVAGRNVPERQRGGNTFKNHRDDALGATILTVLLVVHVLKSFLL